MKSVIFLIIFWASTAWADTFTFTWDANTESDLAGYRLYQRNDGSSYGPYVQPEIPAMAEPTAEVTVMDGSYCWVVTAVDTTGNESGYSNEVCKAIDSTPPSTPNGLVITITIRVEK